MTQRRPPVTSPDKPADETGQHVLFTGPILNHNARFGLVLFLIYLALYLGFIVMAAWAQNVMARPALGGMNVAVVYGFALIIAAFLLAMVYMVFCKPDPAPAADLTEGALAEEAQKEEGSA
jgi:uncharacterized membrane protein (DUF485 family)